MNASRFSRTALVAGLALGLVTASPAWADGHGDHDGFGPAAAIFGIAAAAAALPYVFGAPRVVVPAPAPVYAPPPVYAYTPPPAYVYAPPTYVYAPSPEYRMRRDARWHRRWHGDDDR